MLNWLKKIFGLSTPARKLHKASDDEFYERNDDVLIGYKFSATLQLSTPLEVLKHHGEIHKGPPSQAPVYGCQEHGIWVPEVDPEYNLLAHLEGEYASDIGPITDSEYLPFLIKFREIYEGQLTVSEKLNRIDNLLSEPTHSSVASKIKKSKPDFPHSMISMELTEIDGIGKRAATILYQSGYTSIEELHSASDSELLSIKGIGKETLKKIRDSSN